MTLPDVSYYVSSKKDVHNSLCSLVLYTTTKRLSRYLITTMLLTPNDTTINVLHFTQCALCMILLKNSTKTTLIYLIVFGCI